MANFGYSYSFLPGVDINTTPTGVIRTSSGQTTLDKILQTALQSVALLRNAPYIPTEEVPTGLYGYSNPNANSALMQQQLLAQQLAAQNNAGANFGASVQDFLTNNTGIILIGVVAYMLLMSGRK